MLLNHVLDELKIKAEHIVLVGDSAGANLVMSLLSHVSHPHRKPSFSLSSISHEEIARIINTTKYSGPHHPANHLAHLTP